ncbi:glycosyl hydrolase family 18 protein [Cohnella faecalis]|uniref:Glycosyl hydrolase n=2 Tax=Cohnella faecalis TaxID=2315694 RepID=A0A398CTK7_9BACL|nr:glycosyl hydrolase family 18 protein [Cohnella faecalis]RIE03187.1 glycosyl hydrolase [Cohnella faecalis]
MFLLFVMAAGAAWWLSANLPNSEHTTPDYRSKPSAIMIRGEWTGAYARGDGEGIRLPLEVAQKLLGDGVRYESGTESIILTTDTGVLHFKTGDLDATLNRKPFTLRFSAEKVDGKLYLPLAPLKELFGVRSEVEDGTGIVTLLMPDSTIPRVSVKEGKKKGAKLRSGPDKSYPIVEDLEPGAALRAWSESKDEDNGWYRVQAKSGQIGFVSPKDVEPLEAEKVSSAGKNDQDKPFVAWKTEGQRINLTWEAIYSVQPDTKEIGELKGVNVVSPTWFELLDGTGTIRSKADAGYSAWARAKGIQVWGLFNNSFDPDRTTQALASYESRFRMIQQLSAYAKTFRLQGINIDFENVKTSDKDNLVQFVREMTPILHEQGLVVSIDVTPKSSSEMWSLFLDRARLGQVVDFMMLMAYDEHWASSPVAGSVSSLPWAENSVKRLLEEEDVPSEKLILGIPFYAREWTETPDGQGGVKVSSKAYGMDAIAKTIKSKKLTPTVDEETGQHYVEYKDKDVVKKIWLEDDKSIQARAELVKKYNLAGIASWSRSFASEDIWALLDKHLQSGKQ